MKHLIAAILLAMTVPALNAQQLVKIKLKNQTEPLSYPYSEIERIYFERDPNQEVNYEMQIDAELGIPQSTSIQVSAHFTGDFVEIEEHGIVYSQTETSLPQEGEEAGSGVGKLSLTGSPSNSYTYELTGLASSTLYYGKVYVLMKDEETPRYGEPFQFTTAEAANSQFPRAEMVDLGLSVLWSSWNMGATSEYEFGGYYGWGDPTGQLTSLDFSLYAPTLVNTSIAGNKNFDIATAQWGDGWSMPTREQWRELRQCTWSRVQNKNGVYGYTVNGINGCENNSIFIPVAGYRAGSQLKDVNGTANYWTSEVTTAGSGIYLQLTNLKLEELTIEKAAGMSVRPVYAKGTTPDPDPDPTPSVDPTKDIATDVNRTGSIPEAGVDMGVSVKWASWNLGAIKNGNQIGRYYAWGETETKETFSNDTYTSVYKEVTTDDIENKTIAEEYDAAHALWGGTWRMPTVDEVYDLIAACTIKKDFRNGYYGLLLTSKTTGNTIFLPFSGYYNENNQISSEMGFCWTSTPFTLSAEFIRKNSAQAFRFEDPANGSDEPMRIQYLNRYYGLPIRPVQP